MLRLILAEPLYPITKLTDAESVGSAYREIVHYLGRLHDECKTPHRDIGIYNLMYREAGGGVHGVLLNFDLPPGPQSEQRQGTQEFMPVDLHDHEWFYPYRYRHDLESMFHTMMFHVCYYHDGAVVPAAKDLLGLSNERLSEKKWKDLLYPDSLSRPTERFAPLAGRLRELALMFQHGYLTVYVASAVLKGSDNKAKQKLELEPIDEETYGGCITFSKFEAILGSGSEVVIN